MSLLGIEIAQDGERVGDVRMRLAEDCFPDGERAFVQ